MADVIAATAEEKEKEWQATSDARTLAEANIILSDDKRLKAARKAANKLAKETIDELEGLLKVAGKLQIKIEGMRILKK